MDIQNIRAFMMVSETSSFSRAAERLHLTQPAISKRIQAMELALDIPLFDRIGKSVQLTEAGRAIIPGCQRILSDIEENQRIISNLRDSTRGQLSLATSHHIGLHRLPPVLRSFAKNYPEVELNMHFLDSETACEQVIHGNIELAIITLPEQPDERLSTQAVWQDPMQCVVSSSHDLASKQKVTRQQLLTVPAILPTTGTTTRQLINQTLSLDENTKVLLETSYLETIKAMIETGLGWGVLPASMLDDSLNVINLKNIKMQRQLGVVTHKARTRSSSANALLKLLL